MTDTQKQKAVKPKAKNMQTHENAKPKRQNPRPNGRMQHHGPNPNFRPNQGRVPYNAREEIAALKQQLEESENRENELHRKWVTSFGKAAQFEFQLEQLFKHYNNYKTNSEATIKDLKKQLAEARGEKPKNNSDTVIVADKNPVNAKLGDVIDNMQEQKSHPAAELCAEPSSQATEVSHTDLKSAKEADAEVQCSNKEQTQQLQQQLQEAPRQLEEQAAQHRQERERVQPQINELKSEKEEKSSIEKQLQKSEAEKELLPQTAEPLQESAQEKQGAEQGKDEKGDSLLETLKSLQESVQTRQDKENILISKVDELEEQPTIEPEKPKKKKKKRNWFLRLFTRNSS